VKVNWLHSKGLNGRTRKILAKIMSEFQINKKYMDYSTRKLAKWGVYLLWGTFDLQNGTFWPRGLTRSIAKVLTDVHDKFRQKLCRNSWSPKSPWTSTRKSAKLEVFLLWVTFDLQNGTFWPRGLIWSISNVLTDVHDKFWQKLCRNSRSPKIPWTIAHENRQNWGVSCSGEHLTFKMGRFGREG